MLTFNHVKLHQSFFFWGGGWVGGWVGGGWGGVECRAVQQQQFLPLN